MQKLLTMQELSNYLSMPIATIYSKKCRGEFPAGSIVKIDGKPRFDKDLIDKWIEAKRILSK